MNARNALLAVALLAAACSSPPVSSTDVGNSAQPDSGAPELDSGLSDSGTDAGILDASDSDAGSSDVGLDAGDSDAGAADVGMADASTDDAGGPPPAGSLVELAPSGISGAFRVATATASTGFVVWQESGSVRGSTYGRTSGWSVASTIEAGTVNVNTLELAASADGTALAGWVRWDGGAGLENAWISRYDGTSWSAPELLETSSARITYGMHLAMDDQGNGFAVWEQGGSIWARRRTASGWSAPVELGAGRSPWLACRPDGTSAVAVWYRWDGSANHVSASIFSSYGGWSAAEQVDLSSGSDPQVAMDASGNFVVAYWRFAGTGTIYGRRHAAGQGWEAEAKLSSGAQYALDHSLAMDRNGETAVAWHESDGTVERVFVTQASGGGGWSTPQSLGTGSAPAASPQLAFGGGAPSLTWVAGDMMGRDAWFSTFVAGSGWTTPDLLDQGDSRKTNATRLARDPSGRSTAVFDLNGALMVRTFY